MKSTTPASRARISNGAIVRIFNMLAAEAERIDADPRMIADTLYAIHEYMQEECVDPAEEDDTLVLDEVYEKLKAEVDRSALRSMRARLAAAMRKKATRQNEPENLVVTQSEASPMPLEFPTPSKPDMSDRPDKSAPSYRSAPSAPRPRSIKLVPISRPRKKSKHKRV